VDGSVNPGPTGPQRPGPLEEEAIVELVEVTVDPGRCVGSTTCAGMAPSHFTVEDGLAVPLVSPARLDEELQDAIESCPVRAISVRRLAP
jgi:ferredoxin